MIKKTIQICFLLALFCGCQAIAQEKDAADPEKLERQVAATMGAGDYAEAAEALNKLIKLDDQRVEYHFTLGDALFMNAQMKESIAALEAALRICSGVRLRF